MLVLWVMIIPIIWIFLLVYLFIKQQKEYQIIQQSGYDFKRYIKHIKENKFKYIALNEVLLLATFFVYSYVNLWLAYLLIFLITFYNMKFFTISQKRYIGKKDVVYTARMKRILLTDGILNLIILVVCVYFSIPLSYYLILLAYISPVLLILVLVINSPIENAIKNMYKKKAQTKLNEIKNITKIGITGSYGKTSVKNIVHDILAEYEPTLMTPASFNTPNGISITVNNHMSVLHKNFIAEMGAYYPGEIKELAVMVKPDIAIVSSIGNQHLETFKTIENVQKTKMELVENLNPGGLAILNIDEEYIESYQIQRKDIKIQTYAIENSKADVIAKDIEYDVDQMKFTIVDKITNETIHVSTRLLGKHSVYNILAAYLVAKEKNMDTKTIVNKIKHVNQIKHRLELKKLDENTIIIDDAFNGNVKGIQEGINILSKYKDLGFETIIITPGLIDLGSEQEKSNKEVAQKIKGTVDMAYIVGNYNKKYFKDVLKETEAVDYVDNFLDAYNKAIVKKKKVILIANDLPDKFN